MEHAVYRLFELNGSSLSCEKSIESKKKLHLGYATEFWLSGHETALHPIRDFRAVGTDASKAHT